MNASLSQDGKQTLLTQNVPCAALLYPYSYVFFLSKANRQDLVEYNFFCFIALLILFMFKDVAFFNLVWGREMHQEEETWLYFKMRQQAEEEQETSEPPEVISPINAMQFW